MPETEVGPLKASVILDLARNWNSSISKMQGDIRDTEVKSKELGNVMSNVGSKLGEVAKMGLALGAGLIGSLTGILAFSPQFKEFMAKLKPSFLQLALHVGEKLKPLLDTLVPLIEDVVDRFSKWDEETGFLDWVSATLTDLSKDAFDIALRWAGNLSDFLIGKGGTWENPGGLIGWLNSKKDLVSIPFEVDTGTKDLVILGGILLAMGGPVAKLAGTAILGYAAARGAYSGMKDIKSKGEKLTELSVTPGEIYEAAGGGSAGAFHSEFYKAAKGLRLGTHHPALDFLFSLGATYHATSKSASNVVANQVIITTSNLAGGDFYHG